jgi:hypothetical protein
MDSLRLAQVRVQRRIILNTTIKRYGCNERVGFDSLISSVADSLHRGNCLPQSKGPDI